MSLCLSVPKDLTNCWTDTGLLYSVASDRFGKVFIFLKEGKAILPGEIAK